MKLAQLLKGSDVKVLQNAAEQDLANVEIAKVTLDSRVCAPQTLFIAARGATNDSRDGHCYVKEALESGASAVVIENINTLPDDIKVPVFVSPCARKVAADCAERLNGSPSYRLSIAGITGTNGKTSTTFFLASILKHAGFRSSVVGTLGIGDVSSLKYTGFTTPEAESLSPAFAHLLEEGVSHVAMEVSSHALELFRCDAIRFSAAAFLNLSPDHLDFHGDMASYRKAKERLFLELLPQSSPAVLPVNDPLVTTLNKRGHSVLTFGRSDRADIYVDEVRHLRNGTSARLHLGEQVALIELPVFGDFNLDNVMCAAGLALALGVSKAAVFHALPDIAVPPGRLERVKTTEDRPEPLVLVDFAHTPDALEKSLKTTRAFSSRSLRVVFGCGGNRDRQKRPLMGKVAAELADEVWITDDNPRHEISSEIIKDICQGIDESLRYKVKIVPDRAIAIGEAILNAHLDDTILIAGKGHEATQQIGDVHMPFSDKIVARGILEGWKR